MVDKSNTEFCRLKTLISFVSTIADRISKEDKNAEFYNEYLTEVKFGAQKRWEYAVKVQSKANLAISRNNQSDWRINSNFFVI